MPRKAAATPKAKAEPAIDEELVAASIPDATGPYWVTPELAALWLHRNENNRLLREGRVAAMARDMLSDDWAYTGEAIKFDVNGKLIDGQHRLKAVIRSNTTVKMLVVLDLPADAQAYMDAGATRTAGDALQFRGEANPQTLAATVRFAILFENRRGAESSVAKGRSQVTHAEVIEWLAAHPDIRRQVGLTNRHYSKIDMKPSVFSYALWRINALDEQLATRFFNDIVDMRSAGAGDPIYTLLQRFRTARKHREYLAPTTELSFLFRVWNAYRAGQTLKILKVPQSDWDVVEPR